MHSKKVKKSLEELAAAGVDAEELELIKAFCVPRMLASVVATYP
jgi:hypothetical protein